MPGSAHRPVRRAIVAAAVLVAATAIAFAQLAVPPLTGRVVDSANILSAQTEQRIDARLASHEQKSGNQIAVLTIPSLRGEVLEQYSLKVARQWQLGDATLNSGALLLIARDDRKLRIETGYGVESQLTDAIASFIIRNRITPHFKQGDFDTGVRQGVNAMIDVLEADKAALERWQERAKPQTWNDDGGGWIAIVFVIVWLMIFFSSFITGMLVRWFGKEIKPGHYRWMGMDAGPNAPKPKRRRGNEGIIMGGGGFGGRGGSFGGGGFSGGGGGFGGGGSSGSW